MNLLSEHSIQLRAHCLLNQTLEPEVLEVEEWPMAEFCGSNLGLESDYGLADDGSPRKTHLFPDHVYLEPYRSHEQKVDVNRRMAIQ